MTGKRGSDRQQRLWGDEREMVNRFREVQTSKEMKKCFESLSVTVKVVWSEHAVPSLHWNGCTSQNKAQTDPESP